MAYNTTWAKWKSTELSGLDCGYSLRQARTDLHQLIGTFTNTGFAVEPGQCIAMIRVPAGTKILGGQLTFSGTSGGGALGTSTQLGVGDPFGCARLLGPIFAGVAGIPGIVARVAAGAGDCCLMRKTSTAATGGDGCGIGYVYTCETDIFLSNLYNEGYAALGGWQGSVYAAPNTADSTPILAGATIILTLTVKPV